MHWNRRHRRGRPPHPDVLTPAEWRVLDEVREGRTNTEIAARMGLSFNTVKSHVSSILAKTGLPDRYALAEWDGAPSIGAQTDDRRRARGLLLPVTGWLSSGVAKVVAGGLGAVVLVGAVVVVFSQLVVGGEDVPVVPGAVADGVPGLYLEADVTMVYPGSTRAEPVVLALRWWAAESGARRFEVDGFPGASVGAAEYSFPSLLDTRNQLIVHDGDQSAVYDEDHDAFVETSVTESASPYGLGHYPDLPESDSLDEFVEHLSSLLDRELRHTGTEELLDRGVEVFEDGDGSAGGQVHRLYIDPGELVVLRADIGEVSAQVTRLEIDALIDPALLEFASPPESDLARCPRTEGAGVSPFVTLNPSGWIEEVTGRGGCVPDGGSATQMTIFQPSGGGEGYVLFEQTRRLGARVPESLRGTSIEVGGQPGWRSTAGNGIERVAWESDGVVAMLESDVLGGGALTAIAQTAMPPRDDPPAVEAPEPPPDLEGAPHSTDDLRQAIEGAGVTFLYYEPETAVCPGAGTTAFPFWSAGGATDFGPVFVAWVYPDIATRESEWAETSNGVEALVEGCEPPTEHTWVVDNVVMTFATWASAGEEYLDDPSRNPADAPAVAALLGLGAGSPPGHPFDVRTGEPELDAVIDTVLAGDVDALFDLARFGLPCVEEWEDDFQGEPICPEGVAEGTIMPAMTTHGCHPIVRTPEDLRPDLAHVGEREIRLYAVIDLPAGEPAEYEALFSVPVSDGKDVWGWSLLLGQGGFVSIDGGCAHTPAEQLARILERYGQLEVILPPPE